MTHELKTWPWFFEATKERRKTFELRKDDRGFKLGDELVLREWDPDLEAYTGEKLRFLITYVMGVFEAPAGLETGYVILGLGPA